ncbi:hypothetical protein GCM10020367_64560 [Streptomyces sannanensis]|uniref:Uncharacterized protein n=1 Tax=Streptomyces sannanensis TaxID=285536 RepID=A0ABP6S4D0_9ACTN
MDHLDRADHDAAERVAAHGASGRIAEACLPRRVGRSRMQPPTADRVTGQGAGQKTAAVERGLSLSDAQSEPTYF